MKQLLLLGLAMLAAGSAGAVMPKGASAPECILSSADGFMAPVWSPDGGRIAVTSDNYSGIFVANADGSALHMVTSAPGAGYQMLWTDDATICGRTNIIENGLTYHEVRAFDVTSGKSSLVMAKHRGNTTPRLAVGKKSLSLYTSMVNSPEAVAAQTPALRQFAGKMVINPAVSPDGSKIAFQIVGEGMWLINADGSGLKALGAGSHPAWLDDNQTIVYTLVTDNGVAYTGSTLFALDTQANRTITLTAQAGMLPLCPAVSPDGKKVAFENAADNAIYVINLKY